MAAVSLLLLFTFRAEASYQELSEDLVGMPLVQLCSLYRSPLSAENYPSGFFRVDSKLTEKRRKASEEFSSSLAPYRVPMTEEFRRSIDAWSRSLEIEKRPQVILINQRKLCHDQAESRLSALAPGAKGEARSKMLTALEADCLEESWGRANFHQNEVYFAEELLSRHSEGSLEFAYMHELCHLKYPAIAGSMAEEIFCDAVAVRWLSGLGRSREDINRSIRTILNPPNPYKDFLLLRAHLPELCLP